MDRRQPYRTEEGIVVGRKVLPQGDLLLRFVTPGGSLEALAKKGSRPTGRSGRLSLFHHVRFQLYAKEEALPLLTQAELLGKLFGLEEPRRFLLAGFLSELAYRLASPEAAGRVWPVFVSGLRGIAKHENPLLPLVWAGWRVVKAGGLAPDLRGEGERLKEGRLGAEGVYLGPKGVEALWAILHLPGGEALGHLEEAPLERLFLALKAHAEKTLGPLQTAGLLRL
ncbi:recombinational DNA repair protein (RecF pathway) [Thermus oshimai JL-2]|uniref:Recombinational DNA repair protein (RecF pathway) n=1 Tax=Thermus oshimai JL-2 TaxID=751945 RepID=K7QYW9_THEOS|nr:recombination protein O N-terminal domain-containing protein [Thermus oshimai]AFV75935.1 recombinational DNA repair protein (RecF pathway) [Thermus oshimai JL-2]